MTPYDKKSVEFGTMLIPDRLWNATERKENQLPSPVKVLGVSRSTSSQEGYLYLVRKAGGVSVWLDAGWFIGIAR